MATYHPPSAPDTHSLEFYRSIISKSKDLISVLDTEGRYIFVGESAQQIYGYKPVELLGKRCLSFIHPDDQPIIQQCIQTVVAGGQPQVPPFRYRVKSGEWRWVQSEATNLLDDPNVQGILINSKDVTEPYLTSFERDHHQAYYRSLFFEHPDTVFTLSIEGTFQHSNQHMETLTGYSEADLETFKYIDIVHPDSLPSANMAFARVLEGEAHTVEIKIVTKDKTEKYISVSVMPVYFGGKVKGIQGIARDITQATEAQALIKEQAQQLNNILESITEPLFALDSSWCFTYVSSAFANFMQRTREEITGREIWSLFPKLSPTRLYKVCHEIAGKTTSVHFEESYQDTYPISCTLNYTLYSTSQGITVQFSDVTEQKHTQRELEKLSLVASKTINGIMILDPDTNIEWVNDGFCRLTGYTREEVIGISPKQLYADLQADDTLTTLFEQKYKSMKPFSLETLGYKKNKEQLWCYSDVTPIFNKEGELTNYIVIETDITEKKEAEAKLLKLTDDLYKQNRDLQQFTYIISHNLRAPVANALGLANLVQKLPKNEPTFASALEKLHTSVNQLDAVIKDINHVLSIRDSGRTASRELVNLKQVCEEVLESFVEEIPPYAATVTVDIAPDHNLLSIKSYLFSILHNLVSNSLKYKSNDRKLKLTIQVVPDDRGYIITVSDNGLGFDLKMVGHQMFQLYKRFHPLVHGKGIGLFLVKTQVEALGAKLL
ncbi:PAS domain-containing sensor histidine kinase [Pontibacter rugosus]